MTSKERLLCAIDGGKPDRLPVTTHHLMPYFLDTYANGMGAPDFFENFGLDPVHWINPYTTDVPHSPVYQPKHDPGFETPSVFVSEKWIVKTEYSKSNGIENVRYAFETPSGNLSTSIQGNEQTVWLTENLIKEKSDIEIFSEFAPIPLFDYKKFETEVKSNNHEALIRGTIPGFDVFGQPGCWQDAAELFGIERLIIESLTDPDWVHEFLKILLKRKLDYVRSLSGAPIDIIELGGGSASSTIISPTIFEEFVLPYDSILINEAHKAGQRIVYHICGGIMHVLELAASMKPNAIETFTPPGMGADADLKKARDILGPKTCMIGGFDQYHFFRNCSTEKTRQEVRRCFNEAGSDGAYILSPSDHFFDADLNNIIAFSDEARKCTY